MLSGGGLSNPFMVDDPIGWTMRMAWHKFNKIIGGLSGPSCRVAVDSKWDYNFSNKITRNLLQRSENKRNWPPDRRIGSVESWAKRMWSLEKNSITWWLKAFINIVIFAFRFLYLMVFHMWNQRVQKQHSLMLISPLGTAQLLIPRAGHELYNKASCFSACSYM